MERTWLQVLRCCLAAVLIVGAASLAEAVPVKWDSGAGANDHWYDYVIASLTWAEARDAAPLLPAPVGAGPGYLATITSAEEEAFILAEFGRAYGWMGASDAVTEGTWFWVTEPGGPIPMVYTNWAPGQPDDDGYEEDHGLHGWLLEDPPYTGKWGDLYQYNTTRYLVEWSPVTTGVPEPATLLLVGVGLLGVAVLRRRRRAR